MPGQTLSVIIPVYNGGATLRRCLESVFKSSYPYFECIVVDDHSSDDTVEVAQSFHTRIISMDRQGGAARARNRGAEAAKGDILYFVDSDVEIHPNCLDTIVKSFDENKEIAALFGSYDDQPGCPNFFSQYKNLFHHYIHQTSREEASTFWSGCGAVKRSAFQAVGGFDDNKYSAACIEDIEMGYRLKKMGYRILLNKYLRVKHLKHFSFSKLLKSDLFDRAIPWTVSMLTHKEYTSDLNLKPEHKLSALVVMLVIASVVMTLKSKWFLLAVPALLSLYFIMNHDFYRFFLSKRRYIFTLKVIPLHLLYYLYSTLGFFMGSFKYLFDRYRDKHGMSFFGKGSS